MKAPDLAQPLLVATGNAGKIREIRTLLEGEAFPVALASEEGIGWDSPEEIGGTYRENALLKAASLGMAAGRSCLGEDTGLEVDALGGEPGLRSARLAPTSEERNRILLERLAEVPEEERTARFVCCMAFFRPGSEPRFFEGELRGRIASSVSGAGGFGYDPLFVPEGHDVSLAELGGEIKNQISHRARALSKFVAWVREEVVLSGQGADPVPGPGGSAVW